jgi:peptidyl-Lys metalloendopeptidase
MQEAANNSLQMKKYSDLQAAANNSPQVQKTAQLKAAANGKDAEKENPVQAKAKEKEFVPNHNSDEFAKSGEKKKISKAMASAHKMITKAKKNVSKENKKYKTWMDAGKTDTGNTDTRVAHVKDGIDKIAHVLAKEEVILKQYELGDGEEADTYAYVYQAEKEHNIYLGGAFWKANTGGWNSKAGTIIHELSHRVHGTDDHVYGKTDAKKLAKDEPHLAVTNADNYEFLAEGS